MKERLYLISLYDIYSDLLTDKQGCYFEDYYFNNLTLSEISENNKVSRSAVSKSLNEISDKLNNYEDKLHLYNKYNNIKSLKIDDEIKNKILDILK